MLSSTETERIAILGFGREGQAAVDWLDRHSPGARVCIFDENADIRLPAQMRRTAELKTGKFDAEELSHFDRIVKSPGIPLSHPALAGARKKGVDITSGSNLWFLSHGSRRTIGVSGTKGKSTTASLIAHLLRAAGEPVELAGNVGRPLLEVPVDTDAWVVVELSSYQLADFSGELELALLLNIYTEHLDWHGSADAYHQAKLRLLDRAQQALAGAQVLQRIAGLEQMEFVQNWEDRIPCDARNRLMFQDQTIPAEELTLRGAHNVENVRAALAVVDCLNITLKDAGAALAAFRPLPHRLETVAVLNGVRFVDDSISTTPESTLAALQAFPDQDVILLVGGFDRGLDWRPVAGKIAMMPDPPLAVIHMPDNGTQIAEALQASGVVPPAGYHQVSDMSAAMLQAAELATGHGGNLVLLSPGAPSFGQYRDYQERGNVFRRYIREIEPVLLQAEAD